MQEQQANTRLQHHGQGGELFVIFIVNVLLKIVTLGIYHFWAKTKVRRYLWTHTSFDGERFEYTGKGSELFIGYLIVMGSFIGLGLLALAVIAGLEAVDPGLAILAAIVIYTGVLSLIPMGLYMARRYMLSRTRFRSIRFSLAGSPFRYMLMFVGYGLLSLITLGLLSPIARNALYSFETNNMGFGSESFAYDGRGRDLIGKWLIAWVLMLPTLGLISFWFMTLESRYRAEHTRLGAMSFSMDMTTWQLIGLVLVNMLLIVFTLGLATPWVIIRNLRFMTTHLQPAGELNYRAIAQSTAATPRAGEGLVEAFDVAGI
jgi:uncharacterized membrane protein YjgN (DUF898 family)